MTRTRRRIPGAGSLPSATRSPRGLEIPSRGSMADTAAGPTAWPRCSGRRCSGRRCPTSPTPISRCAARLSRSGATIVVFTGTDVAWQPVFRSMRGKVAIYNENLRAVADRYDCVVADQWGLKQIQDSRFFDADRLHLNALGHHEVARMVLRTLDVRNDLVPMQPDPLPPTTWRTAWADDLVWARTHLVPWVLRRLRHQSSGDHVTAKRPDPLPMTILAHGRAASRGPHTTVQVRTSRSGRPGHDVQVGPSRSGYPAIRSRTLSAHIATALAAATFSESTPPVIGIVTIESAAAVA